MDKAVLIGYYNAYLYGKHEVYFDNGLVYFISRHKKERKIFVDQSSNIEKAKEQISKLNNFEVLP